MWAGRYQQGIAKSNTLSVGQNSNLLRIQGLALGYFGFKLIEKSNLLYPSLL